MNLAWGGSLGEAMHAAIALSYTCSSAHDPMSQKLLYRRLLCASTLMQTFSQQSTCDRLLVPFHTTPMDCSALRSQYPYPHIVCQQAVRYPGPIGGRGVHACREAMEGRLFSKEAATQVAPVQGPTHLYME
eukprot:1148169-Pelagomonas_calceolata.AAC.5